MSPKKILIVDDNQVELLALSVKLKARGYDTLLAEYGAGGGSQGHSGHLCHRWRPGEIQSTRARGRRRGFHAQTLPDRGPAKHDREGIGLAKDHCPAEPAEEQKDSPGGR